MSVQLRPSPAKPWLHWHVYDPVRLVHVALGEHCACIAMLGWSLCSG